jgi:hypothetical protein
MPVNPKVEIKRNPDMTYEQAEDFYISQIDLPHGKSFAETVGRFQEGFLRDRVTDDPDESFRLAVDTAKRLLPVIALLSQHNPKVEIKRR